MRRFIPLAVSMLIGACAAQPPAAAVVPPPPAAVTQPAPPPAPPPLPPTPRYTGDWRDWPLSPGTWVYRQDARGSIALFGVPGADADLTVRCDRAARTIFVSRRGAAPGNALMNVRTSTMARQLTTQPTGAQPAYMAVALTPSDALLDAISYSRGRFVIEQGTLPTLVIPAWAEAARVTEDCRQ